MKKMELIMETEKARATRAKTLRKYEDKIKKDMKIIYEENGNRIYQKMFQNIQIKSFIYDRYKGSIVITVKDMLTGCELSEAVYL